MALSPPTAGIPGCSRPYRIADPRPLIKSLVEAVIGPRARGDDPDGAAIVTDALR
jgi:hypothetical protein